MTPAAREAHLRMLETLPRRTHFAPNRDVRIEWGHKRTPEQQRLFEQEVREMDARGFTRTEICEVLHCQRATIVKILGPSR